MSKIDKNIQGAFGKSKKNKYDVSNYTEPILEGILIQEAEKLHKYITTQNMEEVFKDGLIIYSADGYMSAILTYTDDHVENPGLDVGYCGKYKINQKEEFVSHLRDVIAINNETENVTFVRDYQFSDDGNFLTLSPREAKWKGTSLTWKKVE